MVRSYAILAFIIFLNLCNFSSTKVTTSSEDQQSSVRALYNALEDSLHGSTLDLMLQDYILINSTRTDGWTNPVYAYYDEQLIVALRDQLESEDDFHSQLQADHASSLPVHGGLKFFTYYCGPGNWSVDGSTVENLYFSSIDQCCKQHDECPDTIVERSDYRRYDGLPYKPQIFTRLRCNCDVEFLSCLQKIATFFSYAVAWIYTKFQSNCFDYEYPVLECSIKKNDGFFTSDRCLTYSVDNSYTKRWQWFDIPYMSSNQVLFPEVEYRHKLDWLKFQFRWQNIV